MKALLFLAPLLAFQYSSEPNNEQDQKTFYKICTSHPQDSSTVKGIQVILYTEVSKLICEEKDIAIYANKWWDIVKMNCENATGCTSEINTFDTEEHAKLGFEKAKEYYKDEKKFVLKKLSLE